MHRTQILPVTKEDIECEARVVSELCQKGNCDFVVEVIKHGWFPRNFLYYYIDMEYYQLTLEAHIHGNSRSTIFATIPPQNVVVETRDSGSITTFATKDEICKDTDLAVEFDWQPILNIVDEISAALVYVHGKGTVHRDLKPRNGTIVHLQISDL
jgi:serine/threonine protein kinase